MRSACERRAKELNVGDACRFLGYTSSSAKEELMNACDLICTPSRNEPFGVVVLEAWDACKTRSCHRSCQHNKELRDGLIAYIQPESIAWCINRLLQNPEEMKKLGRSRTTAGLSLSSVGTG